MEATPAALLGAAHTSRPCFIMGLITRPRRFGKTLNQFMIRRFFEEERTRSGERIDNAYLFDGLKIAECGDDILSHQQQYPVIFLTMKSAKQPACGYYQLL